MRKIIVNSLFSTASILTGLKVFFPFLAFLYLLSWCLHVTGIAAPFFELIDSVFGLLPKIIDSIFHVNSDIMGQDVSMGNVFASALCIVLTFVSGFYSQKLDKIAREEETLNEKKEIKKATQESKIKKEQIIKEQKAQKEKLLKTINHFCGLVEFRLSKEGDFFQNAKEMEQLKIEFAKMAAKKLKDKYSQLHFAVNERIFFVCEDFSKFNELINDIVKIFKLLSKLSREKNIMPELIFSIYSGLKKEKSSKILEILLNINKMSYFNKVVVCENIKERYKYNKDIRFSFVSLGERKLPLKDGDMDIDLYYLKNT